MQVPRDNSIFNISETQNMKIEDQQKRAEFAMRRSAKLFAKKQKQVLVRAATTKA